MSDNGGADAGTAGPAPELSAADNATDSPSGDASPPAAADTAAAATAGDDTSAGGDAAPPGDGNGGGGGGGGSDDNAPADTASAPEAVSVPPPAPPAAAADDAGPTAADAGPTADNAPAVATSAEQAAPSPASPVAGAGSPTARERTSSVGSGGSGATPRRNRKAMTRASSMRAGKGKVGAAAARRKSLLYAGNVPPSAAARPRHTSSLRNLAEGDDAAEAAEPAEPAEASAAAPAAPATAGAPPGGEATPPASSSGAAAAGAAANTPKKPPGRMTGVMSKMGHLFKTWKKRYFVLEGSTLRYFTDESMDKQKGQIELEVGTTVTPGSKGARHFCVLIMGPGTCTCHIVAAESTRTHRSLCLWWAWHRWENGLAAGRR